MACCCGPAFCNCSSGANTPESITFKYQIDSATATSETDCAGDAGAVFKSLVEGVEITAPFNFSALNPYQGGAASLRQGYWSGAATPPCTNESVLVNVDAVDHLFDLTMLCNGWIGVGIRNSRTANFLQWVSDAFWQSACVTCGSSAYSMTYSFWLAEFAETTPIEFYAAPPCDGQTGELSFLVSSTALGRLHPLNLGCSQCGYIFLDVTNVRLIVRPNYANPLP